ncbi:probable receptor-like protein kinase At1g80640 [Ricinus communis]|uniref:Serine/threonine-protein kinase PBS1, putative n=1 Tax=Ricinus communis TaxID=3988 RepID=B9RNY7_RICCO|nr:probable receptor-like protein kinase At1g80640 [Ricinus communis]EEF46905.1 Serine/threonine-protein kinase PBS1, putative [Ricinus communis]|eukprot:XP_002515456.1 probable receptor-like protein kinase At1g80640 [Ricinus communis]
MELPVIFLLCIPTLIFQFSLVHSLQEHPFVYSPAPSPISPISTSMAAFSPGVQLQLGMEDDHHKMKLDKKVAMLLIVACGILALILLACLFGCGVYYWKFSQRKKSAHCSDAEKGVSSTPFLGKFNSLRMVSNRGSVSLIDYKLLEKATKNFGDDCLLGIGGFGHVYKAVLEDDKHVAVKKLDCSGDDAHREFENEVDLLSKMHHPNIISLVGYSVHEEMGFIVYELMRNGSLEDLLHGPSRGSSLSWHMRLKIALDIARGLEYLHEFCKPAVIHRDLKSSNILLDSNYNAKLSDFGLAVADSSHNKNKLKLSGTVGYVAPEYMLDGELTEKSDVYAFGVVLLELLLGRRPVEKLAPAHCQSIVTWAMPQLTNRASLPNIVDPVVKDTVDEKYLFQVAAVAVLCVQPEPTYRPLITDVVHSLIPLIPLELGGTLRLATPAVGGQSG